jgi:hypothetical protein
MSGFFLGMNTMGFLTAAVFFLRFWRKTADELFAAFSAAFLLFALDQAFLCVEQASTASWSFLFRLAGFGLLILAILRKNLK